MVLGHRELILAPFVAPLDRSEQPDLVGTFLALCLRLVVAITNYERGDNPGSTIITV